MKRFLAILMVIVMMLGTVGRASAVDADGAGTRGLGASSDDRQMLSKTITCSDNSSYSIQVTYQNTSGIPMDGTELLVNEILPGDSGYDAYVDASATKVGVNSEEIGFTRVFDIQIVSIADHSVVYEPEGGVDVQITMQGSSLEEYEQVDVLHFTEDTRTDAETVCNMDTTVSGETVAFTTESFSVYVIVGHEGGEAVTPRVEFHYISPEGTESGATYTAGPYCFENQSNAGGQDDENVFWTQIVKDGETLTHVPTPSDIENSHFEGWYVVNCSSDTVSTSGQTGTYTYRWPKNPERQQFDKTVSVSISGTTVTYTIDGVSHSGEADSEGCLHVYLAPLYMNYRFVDFNDYDGNLVARKLLVLGSEGEATVRISDVTTINPDSDHYFMGWSTVPAKTDDQTPADTFLIYEDGYIVDTSITLKANTDGTFDIYEGTEATGTPKITSYAATGNGDVVLHAEFELAHWLRFIAGENGWGALYVPADYLVGNTPASNLPTTNRVGYHFAGWWTGWQDKTTGTIYYVEQVTDANGAILPGVTAPLLNNDAAGTENVTGTSAANVSATIDARKTGSITGGELTMTDHSYLFAKWTPETEAEYTVVIWMQKVTDSVDADLTPVQYEAWIEAYKAAHPGATDEQAAEACTAAGHSVKTYDYHSSYVDICHDTSQPVGSTSDDRTTNATGFALAPNVTYSGSTLYSYSVDAKVDPQGTTVFNVYFDRNKHTFTFQDHYYQIADDNEYRYGVVNGRYVSLTRRNSGTYWNPNYYYTYTQNNQTITYTGTRYARSNNTWYTATTITALYGQDISGYFPIVADSGVIYNQGERWAPQNSSTYSQVLVIVNQMPDEDIVFNLNTSNNVPMTLNYYVEALRTDQYDYFYTGKYFHLYSSITARYNFVTEDEDFIDIYGFTKYGTDPESTSGTIYGDTVNFFYLRKDFSLTFDTNYPGGVTFDENGATTEATVISGIPFETVLSQYASTPSPNVPDHYVFDGWYEDESGTTPFNFDDPNGIQGDKIVYAKWYPVYYLIEIDPAGGTLAGPNVTNQSSYFWLQYGTTIGRYDTFRDYIEVDTTDAAVAADIAANPQNYYYYRYVNFNRFEHSRWSGYNVADLYYVDPADTAAIDLEKDNEGIKPSFDRLAEYISLADYHGADDTFYQYLAAHVQADSSYPDESTADYWDSQYVNTSHVYRKIALGDPTYTLVGWYCDGAPYDFSSAVTAPVKLTAVWRQSGAYRLHYSPNMTEQVNGTYVFGTLTNSPYDPSESDEGYSDGGIAVIGTAPNSIHGGSGDDNVYIFEGWRLVNASGQPIDENGNVISGTGTLYQPGDSFTVLNTMATNGVINLEAYYTNVSDSARRPHTVNLILDANTAEHGEVVPSASSNWAWVKPGTIQADTSANQILFGDTQSNVSVHLSDFADSFRNSYKYYLLGFDEGSNCGAAYDAGSAADGLRSGYPFIASYAADSVIGIDLADPYPNHLYAVWEPMVYVTFVNDTEADIVLTLSATGPNVLSVVNEANGVCERTPVSDTGNVTVPAGGQVKLVLPYGEGEQITASAVNNHNGYRMSVSSVFAGNSNNAATQVEGSQEVNYGDTASITDTLYFDETGTIVTFTEDVVKYVFYDVKGGTWRETNTGTNENAQYVQDSGDVYSLSAVAIDAIGGYEPTAPTMNNSIFVGWTLYPAIAAQTDFSGTSAVTWGTGENAVTITPDADSNLLAKIKSDYLWDFTEPAPLGRTLYAVWSEQVTVTFDIRSADSMTNYLHNWTDPDHELYVGTGYTRTVTIAKGDKVPQPTNPTTSRINNASFLYWVYNPSNPINAYTTYRGTTTNPSNINAANIFDFAKPVTVNTTLATSWTGAHIIPVTITKQVIDPLNDTTKSFDFTYTIKTYRYASNGGSTATEQQDHRLESEFTLTAGESETIELYYWGVDSNNGTRYFYYQTLEIAEKDYSTEYELSVDSLVNATENGGTVTVNPFPESMSFSGGNGNTARYFHYGTGNYYYRVNNNTWYSSNGYNPQTTTYPVQSASATFTNTRKMQTITVGKTVADDYPAGTFTFTATVLYKGVTADGYDTNDFTDGVRTFTLQHGETVDLLVPYGATLVVEEDVPDEYNVAADSSDFTDADAADESFTVETVDKDGEITFTNTHKPFAAPTDAKLDWKPFLWMLLLGMMLFGLFVIGRRKKEE